MVNISKITNPVVNVVQDTTKIAAQKAAKTLATNPITTKQAGLMSLAACSGIVAGINMASKVAPLGASFDMKTETLNFGVASKNATHINLYIFDKPVNGKVIKTVEMEKHGNNWTAKLNKKEQQALDMDIKNNKAVYYGYRAWGPNWEYNKNWKPGSDLGFKSHVDDKGNRFNPNKLLSDPYSKELSHDPISPKMQKMNVNGGIYATGQENYLKDSAAVAPKSIFVLDNETDTGIKPKRGINEDVIYETHLRGFSKLDEKIPEKYRGTYKGAALKAKYLKDLGITMVEFLPMQEFDDDKNDFEAYKDKNYWGYNTLNFFAPNRRYAYDKTAGGPTREFKEMVKAFHDNGIKVCMDVVYNHTGEGGTWNNKDVVSLYSMRGLDNSSYYETTQNGEYYWDNSGCGANFNTASEIGSNLVADSLKYWAEEMGVDAFRFDLAPVLGNTTEKSAYNNGKGREEGFYYSNTNAPALNKISQKLDLRSPDGKKGSVDLIAEPWGCGDGTYQLGQFPKTWSEWNDKFRNVLRSMFNRQEKTTLAEVACAMAGSSNAFGGERTRSVNFIACHDGFTMKDLFSYNNPYNNNPNFYADGGTSGDGNLSWDNFNDFNRQTKAMKNAFLTLLMSKGTPMINGGDEIMRTQQGNNNAYCLDTDGNYLNWNLSKEQENMHDFVQKAIAFRKAHPALQNSNFFDGKDHNNNGLKDVTWYTDFATEADGNYLNAPYNNFLGMRIDGTEYGDSAASIYTIINKGDTKIGMQLPKNTEGKQWYLVADTAEESEIAGNFVEEGKEIKVTKKYYASPRSTMIFIEK